MFLAVTAAIAAAADAVVVEGVELSEEVEGEFMPGGMREVDERSVLLLVLA